MLWTDSVFISASDLLRLDSQVDEVAQAENIVLSGDGGIIKSSVEELSFEINKRIISFGGYLNSGDLSANHLAAVLNVGIGNSVRQKVSLQQIVVSGDVPGQWSWLQQWAVYWALRSFYRDAFSRTVSDRHKAKMEYYTDELRVRVDQTLMTLGIPIVVRPLSRPGAVYEIDAGIWDSTNVAIVPGSGTVNDVEYDVGITYCDMSDASSYINAAKKNNAESELSDKISVTLTSGNVISIDIGSLGPPTGQQPPGQVLTVVTSPRTATHWNVYVGLRGGTMYLQNSVPIPVSTTNYALPGDPVLSGYKFSLGQYQERRLSLIRTRQRA